METWEQVKQFYKDKFDIEGSMVELATNFDILKMCAAGASNKSIAMFLEIDEELASAVIDKYLGFMGWREDLSFSPILYYKQLNSPPIDKFVEEMIIKFGHMFNMDMKHLYDAASITEQLERLLDDKWI